MWKIKGLPNPIDGEALTADTHFRVIKATNDSLRKWQYRAYVENNYYTECMLCRACRINGCDDCPVYQITGKISCEDSPYVSWRLHSSQQIAEEELFFLEGIHSIFTHCLYYPEYCSESI